MGSYLEVPSIQGRIKNESYAYILDRVNSKLDGWKMNFLSFAGRQIMTQTILNTIPDYIVCKQLFSPLEFYNILSRRYTLSCGVGQILREDATSLAGTK